MKIPTELIQSLREIAEFIFNKEQSGALKLNRLPDNSQNMKYKWKYEIDDETICQIDFDISLNKG